MRRRLDVELVRRGLVDSRERAQAEILAGRVLVGGAPAAKASRLVDAAEPLRILGPGRRFVSRGGDKLDAALDGFGLRVAGLRALDAGASTGGFTDCLLQRGVASVTALDVGHGQLDARLRADPRVRVLERTNLRSVPPARLGARFELVVADLSFISLRTVATTLLDLAVPGGRLVVLVKPQFEAGRVTVSRGQGVVTDPDVWRSCLGAVRASFEDLGAAVAGVMASPLKGSSGNVEFLAHVVAPGADVTRAAGSL